MTVSELVKLLLECRQESEVVYCDWDRGLVTPTCVDDYYPRNETVEIFCDYC